jgi:hypothetical protein
VGSSPAAPTTSRLLVEDRRPSLLGAVSLIRSVPITQTRVPGLARVVRWRTWCGSSRSIVPAVLVLLRERAWWLPRWLDRILPDVDVEGAELEHRVVAREAALAET